MLCAAGGGSSGSNGGAEIIAKVGKAVRAAILGIAASLVLLVGSWPAEVKAAQSTAGFAISPIYQNVTLDPNAPQSHYVATLSNSTTFSQAFKLSTVDFGSLNESGGVAFLGTSSSAFARRFGLSAWMQLDQNAVVVPAGASVDIGVTIVNSSNLQPGGHYGAVLATAQTAPNGSPQTSRVGVLEVLSSLILLVKGGGPPPDLELAAQSVNRIGSRFPTAVTDRFHNIGDVHVVPRGVATVRDPLGKVVARAALNENSGIILPQTYRLYSAPFTPMARAEIPGRYQVMTSYRFDGTEATKTFTSWFWYVPPVWFWVGVALVLAALSLIVWWYVRRRRVRG